MSERLIDEALEAIWMKEEGGEHPVCSIQPVQEVLKELKEKDYVSVDGEEVDFTPAGKIRAKNIIRRHRLAERLLTDVLDFDVEDIESPACRFEHILSEGVDDAICTLLGHPHTCPHGLEIPTGECCVSAKKSTESLVTTLINLSVGSEGKISYVSTKKSLRLQRLMSLGVTPGKKFRLQQKNPSYVISVGETQIALEEDVAQDIYVIRNGAGITKAKDEGQGADP